jgi:hypothetical protein
MKYWKERVMKPSFDFREIEFLNGYTSFKAWVSTVYDLLNSIMTICIYIKNEISNYFSILSGRKQKLRKCLEQECTVQVKSQVCRLMGPCNKWDWCKLRWFCFLFWLLIDANLLSIWQTKGLRYFISAEKFLTFY